MGWTAKASGTAMPRPWTGPSLWSPARHPNSHVGQDAVLLAGPSPASWASPMGRLLAPGERKPAHRNSGNGGNGSPQTLSVFFFFGGGVRRPVARVARSEEHTSELQ